MLHTPALRVGGTFITIGGMGRDKCTPQVENLSTVKRSKLPENLGLILFDVEDGMGYFADVLIR